jgi:hypothetical protein
MVGCSEPSSSPPTQPHTTAQKELVTTDEPPAGYVPTPAGWFHLSCVHNVPDSLAVDASGAVHARGGAELYQIPRCNFAPYRFPQPSLAASPRPLTSAPEVSGYDEVAWAHVDNFQFSPSGGPVGVMELDADIVVPSAPTGDYSSVGPIYYAFPGLEPDNYDNILQPVLTYGRAQVAGDPNPYGGNYWSFANWTCGASLGCIHSTGIQVYPGDSITTSMKIWTDGFGGPCMWSKPMHCNTLSAIDVTRGTSTSRMFGDSRVYTWSLGAVEVAHLTSCNQFPSGTVRLQNFQTFVYAVQPDGSIPAFNFNQLYPPNWLPRYQASGTPQCNPAVSTENYVGSGGYGNFSRIIMSNSP